jgi:cytochrome c-type biogenesis protein CcmH/NrfF
VPWWFWILAVLWSTPIVLVAVSVAWYFYEDHAMEKMIKQRTAEQRAEALVERDGQVKIVQDGNPRARG